MKSEMASDRCLDCPYLEEHLELVLQYNEYEEQAQKKDALIMEASVACRGIQKFWREGLCGEENVKRCPFRFHAPVVSDETMLEELAKVASTQPRGLIR